MAEMIGNGHCHSFNGDGRLDILARSVSTGDLFVYPHSGSFRGTRTYEEPVKIAENFHFLRDHYLARTIDVDGSGRGHVLAMSGLKYNPYAGIFLYPNLGGLNGMKTLGERIHISGSRPDRSWESMGIARLTPGPDVMFGREKDKGHVDAFLPRGEVVEGETFDKTPHRMVDVSVDDFPFAMADVTCTGRPDLLVKRANGDLDVYEFATDSSGGVYFPGVGTWHTVLRGFDVDVFAVTDVDLDGNPDLLALRKDGTLHAYVHNGKFDPERPLATFAPEPEVVATGWTDYNSIS